MNANLCKHLIRLGATNPDFRPHIRLLLAAAAKKEVDSTDIKKSFYECSDGFIGLLEAVKEDSVTKGDKTLAAALDALGKAVDRVQKHLDTNYIWD